MTRVSTWREMAGWLASATGTSQKTLVSSCLEELNTPHPRHLVGVEDRGE